ncbi:MAG: 23S rRNA (adenine(2503)-C(2))-methyltransferase RlmN [Gammaproteobacteria bacterium]|nr:23S rRNA (adenine(2503)-C(2))-methyltransferase RlmN [Gammaproteobacteria bacterium]
MRNLFDYDRTGLEAAFQAAGHKAFRACQIMKWVYHRGVRDFAAMTDLAKSLRAWLGETATLAVPEVRSRRDSADGTIKWAMGLASGDAVETVLIPEPGRNTLCVSSQAGCALDCSFCATGKQGFNGNLTTAEIIGQVWLANEALKADGRNVSNVVLMGMGEPLLNFDAVIRAVNLMMDDLAFGISKRRVTISTAGVVPAIYDLAEVSDVSLAVSLHAPDDALRDELVPINRKYPLSELLAACRHYVAGLGERRALTVEYTLIKGVNDSLAQARALARLLRGLRCKINLIPFNPFPASGFERPGAGTVRAFQTALLDAGHKAMLRTTRGDDIGAACGQLTGAVSDRTKRQSRYLARVQVAAGN